ncbi:hypothetical protein BCR41DRAFT_372004 [Lobosporangium transversale]|uniref:Galactose oxidase n=1 Tax=Lobosporangium transversale TaxID=64571 RepID=A0A1Y2GHJ0_9FUNG|nr:hypothetical protein BCR41DRAFT_409418 [Lobosporangium transversale]XP_021879749.1 hypothetical protein BCR41DRAFT_372004 [Lobosporangium transversale]ORZ11039.1 hypothetical protein BCR41DRAFT_409418 [Lobosporangium transversale]ORZ11652.1 hypothetical protein BCR41DRAFT_372004 [Lobosporangium transversale]|eukprot:XP_021879556.1 hypothetical protein BCR41DRAFT_409418 [Lobosporangium transversale]
MFLGGSVLTTLPTDPTTAQMFYLDLSRPWHTGSPAYQQLSNGYAGRRFASALMKNNQEWFVFINGTAYSYGLGSGSWRRLKQTTYANTGLGLAAATNPVSGWVYIPNGYYSIETGKRLMTYDPRTEDYYYEQTSQPDLVQMNNYMVTWAPGLKSLLVFGGSIIETFFTRDSLYALNDEEGWKTLATNGFRPSARLLGCFIPAYGGTKMILFGGLGNGPSASEPGTVLGDIYILDVATLTWTRGTDVGLSGARAGHVCAFRNPTESPESPNLLVIIGGSIGIVALLAFLGAVFWRHKKNKEYVKPSTGLVVSPDVDPPVLLVAPEPLSQDPYRHYAPPHQVSTLMQAQTQTQGQQTFPNQIQTPA